MSYFYSFMKSCQRAVLASLATGVSILGCPGVAEPLTVELNQRLDEVVRLAARAEFEDSESTAQLVSSAPPEGEVRATEPGYPRLSFEGQLQLQVDDGSLGAPRRESAYPSGNGLGLFPADSRIFIRRLRPSLDVAFSPSFDLQTEYNLDPYNGRAQILEVRFNHDLSEETYLSWGRYKVPFGWEGLRSSRTTNTIERSDMTAALYGERDVGVSLTHREPQLGAFSVGTFLGQPRSHGRGNGGFDVIGRGVFALSESLRVGISSHTGTFRNAEGAPDFPVRRLGTELTYSSGPLRIEAEAMWSDGYNTMSGADTRASGYYIAGLHRLVDSLDLVLHYDKFDPDLAASHPLRGRNQTNARDRKVVGLNYQIEGDLTQRFMLNYEWRSELEGGHSRTNGFRARYQVAW